MSFKKHTSPLLISEIANRPFLAQAKHTYYYSLIQYYNNMPIHRSQWILL